MRRGFDLVEGRPATAYLLYDLFGRRVPHERPGALFQFVAQFVKASTRAPTLVNVPRRSRRSVKSANHRSINRPSVWCQAKVFGQALFLSRRRCWSGFISEPSEMAVDAGDDAFVTGGLGFPSARSGVVSEVVDVGELGFERGLELERRRSCRTVRKCWRKDRRRRRGLGSSTRGRRGLEHLGPKPFDSVGGGATSGGDDEERLAGVHLGHGRFVRGRTVGEASDA